MQKAQGCGRPQSMRSQKSWTGPNNSAILLSLTFIKLMRILPLIVLLFMFYMINHFVFAVFKIFLFIFAFSAFERFHKSFYHSCSGRAFPYSPNTFHGSWISHLFFWNKEILSDEVVFIGNTMWYNFRDKETEVFWYTILEDKLFHDQTNFNFFFFPRQLTIPRVMPLLPKSFLFGLNICLCKGNICFLLSLPLSFFSNL